MKNKRAHWFVIIGICILLALPIIFIFYFVGPLHTLAKLATHKTISGKIYDCTTGKPIEDARVSISGVGWGFRNNSLVWDKVYSESGTSNSQGNYEIDHTLGTELAVQKDEYLRAYFYSEPSEKVDIGLISNLNVPDNTERTYQCKLESECYKEVVKNGVIVKWNSCSNPDYKP